MERIQEAIEKARRERQGNIGSAQGPEEEPKAESLSSNKAIENPVLSRSKKTFIRC